MNAPKSLLQKQLEEQKFSHGISYIEQAAPSIKKITTGELAQLNQLLTGESEDPWRFEATKVRLPSGQLHDFNVLTNPILKARDILGHALQMASNGDLTTAAAYLYSQLVLEHLFRDANRRTAVLATIWLLQSHQRDINAMALLKTPVGDLRNKAALQELTERVIALVK